MKTYIFHLDLSFGLEDLSILQLRTRVFGKRRVEEPVDELLVVPRQLLTVSGKGLVRERRWERRRGGRRREKSHEKEIKSTRNESYYKQHTTLYTP